ncbi:MAG: transcription antitermination factor NusB [Firmicutes bacterium]|nr:transcription antitermination factor NusB [Bacillota bacterium]
MSRRLARQTALEILYQIDITKSTLEYAIENTPAETPLDCSDREFAHSLVTGVIARLPEIDGIIAQFAKDWKVERMAYIDRNILRLATYELKYLDDVPIKVSVNEAVELAKKFSDQKAAKFINGILGTVVDYVSEGENE